MPAASGYERIEAWDVMYRYWMGQKRTEKRYNVIHAYWHTQTKCLKLRII